MIRTDKIQWKEVENNIQFDCNIDIVIHRKKSPTITLILPGVDGTVDGYKGKYKKCANVLYANHDCAVVRMNNPFIASFAWESNLRRILEYISKNSHTICEQKKPQIQLMAHSAGASIAAHIAWEYPEIQKLLLINTAAALQKEKICSGLQKFNGDKISIIYGDDDPSVNHAHTFYNSCKKHISILHILQDTDHHFTKKTNIFIKLPSKYFFEEKITNNQHSI